MKFQLLLVLFTISVSVCDGYHILWYHTTGTKSNLIQVHPLIEEVLNRGHEVTSVVFDTLNTEHENYTEFTVPNGMTKLYEAFSKLAMEEGGINPLSIKFWREIWAAWSECVEDVALLALKEEKVENMLKSNKKFDLVITVIPLTGAFLADHFDCPLAVFTPAGAHPFIMEGTGHVINWSVQPPTTALHIEPLTFSNRLQAHFFGNVEKLFFYWFANKIQYYQQGKLGQHTRNPYDTIRDRLSVILSSSHPVTHGSWPNMPNFIELGGLHLKDPKPLPEDLQSFMDSATKGVVFVSFGSQIKSSELSEDKLSVFLETFRRLEMSVIWKWDADVPNISKNVITRTWLPQQDLLGHPNLKVFVTHGGLGSLMEAIYHKTVVVGIPLTNDQKPNLLRAAKHGYARMLELDTLSADQLTEAINAGVGDKEMRSSMEKIHNVYTDNQQRPLDTAVWWIEYVCRNKGAEILQSWLAYDTPWYQYHHVDIMLFLIAVIIASCSAFIVVCYFCSKLCCKRKIKTE